MHEIHTADAEQMGLNAVDLDAEQDCEEIDSNGISTAIDHDEPVKIKANTAYDAERLSFRSLIRRPLHRSVLRALPRSGDGVTEAHLLEAILEDGEPAIAADIPVIMADLSAAQIGVTPVHPEGTTPRWRWSPPHGWMAIEVQPEVRADPDMLALERENFDIRQKRQAMEERHHTNMIALRARHRAEMEAEAQSHSAQVRKLRDEIAALKEKYESDTKPAKAAKKRGRPKR